MTSLDGERVYENRSEMVADWVRQRANQNRVQLQNEQESILLEIEALFAPAVRIFLKEMRLAKVRPWPPRQGPDREALTALIAAEWRTHLIRYLQESKIRLQTTCELHVVTEISDDLWAWGAAHRPTISISEHFDLSARALSRIGTLARRQLPDGTIFPEAAARWLELLGYEVTR